MLQTSHLDIDQAIYRAIILSGEPWLYPLLQGQTLRIIDLEGNQAVDTLFYVKDDLAERYSANDTIVRNQQLYLSTGSALYSNKGRILLAITADTCGRHDTVGGACSAESNMVRYALDKRPMHSCRDNFLQALIAHGEVGLSKRDLTSNINFFMNVPVTPQGQLTFADGLSSAGRYVEMRAETDVLVLISNCPQLNNPCNAYNPTPIEVVIWN